MTRNGAIAGMLVGALTVILWKQVEGGMFDMYEILPGFILCALTVVVVSLMSTPPIAAVQDEFDAFEKTLHQ
jgi:sodium/proline symporter